MTIKPKYYKNINTGEVLIEFDYIAMLERETKYIWDNMTDEEKAEDWDNNFGYFFEIWYTDDTDFVIVDEEGNDYWI